MLSHYLKAAFLLVLPCLFVQNTLSQDRIPVELKPVQFTLGIIEPSVLAEVRIGSHQSIVAGTALTLGFATNQIYVFPQVRGSIRNYYKRKRVKKELRTNSGNYVGLRGGYLFGSLGDSITSEDKSYYVGPIWGIQRNYQSGIHLGLSLGFGYGNGQNKSARLVGIGHFTFGFVLG